MTTRRQFLKGTVSAAVAASLPASGDGVTLYSAKHPAPALLPMTGDADTGIAALNEDSLSFVVDGHKMATALARSMDQTRERVAADVMEKAFHVPNHTLKIPFDLSSLEEIEVEIKEGT